MTTTEWNSHKAPNTQELQETLDPGDFVRIKGYGGYAKIESIYDSGNVNMYGAPLWRAVVSWGPNNRTAGAAKFGLIEEDFPLGRVEPAHDLFVEFDAAETAHEHATMTEVEMLNRLQDLRDKLAKKGITA